MTRPKWLPTKLKILGHNYEIVYHDDRDTGNSALGTQWEKYLKLWIKSDQARTKMESTLLHEVIEAINSELALELDHSMICRLEAGLYQVLRDNKLWIGGAP